MLTDVKWLRYIKNSGDILYSFVELYASEIIPFSYLEFTQMYDLPIE
jgi:hypothetical protein